MQSGRLHLDGRDDFGSREILPDAEWNAHAGCAGFTTLSMQVVEHQLVGLTVGVSNRPSWPSRRFPKRPILPFMNLEIQGYQPRRRQAHIVFDCLVQLKPCRRSTLGHEQTSRHIRVMSIPFKADIHQRGLHVRLVPEADIGLGLTEGRLAGPPGGMSSALTLDPATRNLG
jgi:hypothetical protein